MEKEFVTYEQALSLKELGFDEPCLAWHNSGRMFNDNYDAINSKMDFNYCCALPLKQQVLRWFRDKWGYGYDVAIQHNKRFVGIAYSSVINFSIDVYDTYEKAENACIDTLISIAKQQDVSQAEYDFIQSGS